MTTETVPSDEATTSPLLSIRGLEVTFKRQRLSVQAVAGIDLDIYPGETIGLVGESGCGKSTTGRAIIQIEKPTAGSVIYDGNELTTMSRTTLRQTRSTMQMIFQDPISSLNPRRKIKNIVAEPLDIWQVGTKAERLEKVREALIAVGIDPDLSGDRYPREFSGGQCQRISIARSLVLNPKFLVCDEMVSALDVSVQAQILNLLEDLKAAHNLTLLFIAHDLAVVKNISDRVAVMYLGRLCELAPSDDLYASPAHPYTAALLSAALEPDPDATLDHDVLQGEPPSPINPPSGCRFRTRCPRAQSACVDRVPELREIAPNHQVACHFPLVGAADA